VIEFFLFGGMFVGLFVHTVIAAALFLFPFWRAFSRAGLDPKLALVVFIPPLIGPLIAMGLLAFSDWPAGEAERDLS